MKKTKASINVNVIVKSLNDTEIKNAIKWAIKTYLKILLVTSPLWILAINYLMR